MKLKMTVYLRIGSTFAFRHLAADYSVFKVVKPEKVELPITLETMKVAVKRVRTEERCECVYVCRWGLSFY